MDNTHSHNFQTTLNLHEVDLHSWPNDLFMLHVMDKPWGDGLNIRSSIAFHDLRQVLSERFSVRFCYGDKRLFASNETVALVLDYNRISQMYAIEFACAHQEQLQSLRHWLKEMLPPVVDDEANLFVAFWSKSSTRGAHARGRSIAVSSWASIRGNYSTHTVRAMDTLINFQPEDVAAGKLILVHGPPGTGKSYALRALMHEWRQWCKPQYIVDAEQFFGDAEYMLNVLLDSEEARYLTLELDEEDRHQEWRLITVEDAGEFLKPDASLYEGQALSRLLNLTDGFIGQGLKVLVLLTTNEEIDTLHAAVSREGRCIADILFDKLSPDEVDRWCAQHALAPQGHELNIAELYALTREERKISHRRKKTIGFGR